MPPYVRTQCPRCQHTFRVDLTRLQGESIVVYREATEQSEAYREYKVTCPECGHTFKIPWPPKPRE